MLSNTGRALRAAVVTIGAAVAGCSATTADLSTTGSTPSTGLGGSLFNSKKPDDPVADRARLAATTSAQAQKCGYNFDPVKLRAGYLSFESGQSTPAPEVARGEKIFDTTYVSLAARLKPLEGYCTDDITEKVKKDLTKNLAGDFALPAKKPEVDLPLFSSAGQSEFDRDKALDVSRRK